MKTTDPGERKKIESRLRSILTQLRERLGRHEAASSARLPEDKEEADSWKGELDVLETEERSEAAEIKQVNGALERLKNDEYGVCLACRMPIPQERLEAMPAAAHCLPCQNTKEHLKTRPPFTID